MNKKYYKENTVDFNYSSLITFIIILFVINHSAYSQSKPTNKIIKEKMSVLKIYLNKKKHINDSLSILLTSFSHKPSPVIGEAERATAHLSLLKNNNYHDIMLSEHGIAGVQKNVDGLLDTERYDSINWNEYYIELKKTTYDQSIEITISKKDD
ncbi:hypothetical protein [Olleya sp. Bg11-27]|uniref:hypothetical protein n=1 Tax=Olleya sp. Bg11-27 TaxID=2058135 RepID=UPI000C31138C|nr:hypothetical protein [Olleya sp. Bg11-27]AUC77131.1 hypothetical protein CW732_16180 [Olleya sp. Bg11-27]